MLIHCGGRNFQYKIQTNYNIEKKMNQLDKIFTENIENFSASYFNYLKQILDRINLFEIRSHVYMDVVFVNISDDADTFEEVHSDLLDRWKEFDKPFGVSSERFQRKVYQRIIRACKFKSRERL